MREEMKEIPFNGSTLLGIRDGKWAGMACGKESVS